MNKLITHIPERNFKALNVIAAAFSMPSANSVVLWAIEALVMSVSQNEPVIGAAIERACSQSELPAITVTREDAPASERAEALA